MSDRMRLTVYMRTYCHLCDDMLAALAPWAERHGLAVETVDIDADPELEQRYGELVPVLCGVHGGEQDEICHYFFDARALEWYLESVKKPI